MAGIDQKNNSSEKAADEFVLVAEDSVANRTVLVLLIRKLGFKVIECDDGVGAWKALSENKDRKIVAVFSDMMMPKMDGLELLRRVRNESTTANLPFVLVTAVSDNDFIFEAKNLNVNGYILKPVTYQRVSAKMKELFPHRVFPQLAS